MARKKAPEKSAPKRKKAPGRGAKGRFLPGHSVRSPGRPKLTLRRELVRVVYDQLTKEEWQKIVRKAIDAAKKNDWRARDFLAKIYLGNRAPSVDDVANDVPEALIE